jgi:hypothetical protein
MKMRLLKIISGGQTGVDQGALIGALSVKTSFANNVYDNYLPKDERVRDLAGFILVGGTAPKGYMTEDGPRKTLLKETYNLKESYSSYYPVRTETNVMDADGTIVIQWKESRGCRLTINMCAKHKKPCLVNPKSFEEILDWIEEHDINIINVAGHRKSAYPTRAEEYSRQLILHLLFIFYLGDKYVTDSHVLPFFPIPVKRRQNGQADTADESHEDSNSE